ncbi:acyl dehydratase [Pseudoclavibacter sp. RFBJ3]|uniref:MaoC/PaaZ C-terminal domain-containing protein n=1 Tax=unclassified Pseudoclavibacter TaxID=2615177 RepID=UPI000CE8A99A|nr:MULTISPECIES: MaoC/PaaZ C-terminal domain-containing protein [unclassified Pseudoclavibacter]PPF82649.1 acyl dehydratase [Pseudoclavibacter sp. RFBJ5]PPF91543.1 acyl dehydratase [Pseudoclavibacter sp. RFBJ3]PPF96466.1 acyl dehydratase [Pseudoclavibacter sp. RFBH5]PPG22211.1 acyl dehydratase [Pseudoclavibacter sp. RFBI4]
MTDTISVAQLPRPDFTSLEAGTVIAERSVTLTRDILVRYAGASGDFNPIHYRDDVAEAVGLPGVLAHGMLTMGVALQPVVDALGDPGRVVDYQVRFTRPVVVDPQAGAEVSIVAKIGQLAGEDGVGRIDLVVSFGGQTVLAKSQVRADFRGEVPAVLPAEATA